MVVVVDRSEKEREKEDNKKDTNALKAIKKRVVVILL